MKCGVYKTAIGNLAIAFVRLEGPYRYHGVVYLPDSRRFLADWDDNGKERRHSDWNLVTYLGSVKEYTVQRKQDLLPLEDMPAEHIIRRPKDVHERGKRNKRSEK